MDCRERLAAYHVEAAWERVLGVPTLNDGRIVIEFATP
jgi:hypothetical protein